MVPVPLAEPREFNAFTTITRLTFLQILNEQVNSSHKQSMYSVQNTNSPLESQNVHPHNQSTVILQIFSMITQELQNFMDKVKCRP